MKKIFTPAMFLLMSTGFLALQSCQKTETLKDLSTSIAPAKNSSGGGGASGSGHNGGSGGGSTVTPPAAIDSSLAPADTTTSQLPVEDIITSGRWKVTSFVQGHDDNTSDFVNYIFTFNSDRTLIADDNGNQTIGFWHNQEAIFYYGIPVYGSSSYGFTMSIGSTLPLTMLNENYFISKKTLTTMYIDSINPNENAHITLSKLAQ